MKAYSDKKKKKHWKYTILVNSCDANKDLWDPFFKIFTACWKGEKLPPIVLNTESLQYSYPGVNIKTFSLLKKENGWGKRLRLHLQRIKTPLVLFTLDDYFPLSEIDDKEIDKIAEMMMNNRDISVCYLERGTRDMSVEWDRNPDFMLVDRKYRYRMAARVSLWRRDRLIKYIRDHETPWQFEVNGSFRVRRYKDVFLYLGEHYKEIYRFSPHTVGLIRGRWAEGTPELFAQYDIDMDFSKRGFSDIEEDYRTGRLYSLKMNFPRNVFTSRFWKEIWFRVWGGCEVSHIKNKPENNSGCAMLVNSCDAYEDLWDPFFKILHNRWSDFNMPVYLNTETKHYKCEIFNVKTINLLQDKDKTEWGGRLLSALDQIKEDYILFMLEDYYLQENVNEHVVKKCLDKIKSDDEIACIYFRTKENYSEEDGRKHPERIDGAFYQRYNYEKWILNAGPAIWRKDDLKSFLRSWQSPWIWEAFGHLYVQKSKKKLLIGLLDEEPAFVYDRIHGGAVHRGKWVGCSVRKILEDNGIDIDLTKRGVIEDWMQIKEPHVFDIKRILKNRYFMIRSLLS